MSCLEHVCRDCGNEWFNNNPNAVCPRCTSTNVSHYFDEDPHDFFEIDDGEDTAIWGGDDE